MPRDVRDNFRFDAMPWSRFGHADGPGDEDPGEAGIGAPDSRACSAGQEDSSTRSGAESIAVNAAKGHGRTGGEPGAAAR